MEEDSKLPYDDQKYCTFNRHYMEYSMCRFTNKECQLTCLDGYDHYRVTIGTKSNYISAMAEPTYFDYTSAVTRTHLVTNPYLIPEILQGKDWMRFVDDYDTYYLPTLGPLRNHITGEVMHCHHRRNRGFPTEKQGLRINSEINDWFS